MGLIRAETGAYELPLEESFLHISEFSNALVQVKGDDIKIFAFYDDVLHLVHQASKKAEIGVDEVFKLPAKKEWVKAFKVNGSIYDMRSGELLNASEADFTEDVTFGVEVVNKYLIIQDRRKMGMPGTVPLIDTDPESPNYGENLIVTDPVTGMMSFVYEAPEPSGSASGIYDRSRQEWKVDPKYYFVIPRYNNGYLLESRLTDETHFEDAEYRVYDANGALLQSPFTDEDLNEDPQLLRFFVPHLRCDSIDPFFENESVVPMQYSAIRFYSGKKAGVFEFHREVKIAPQELMVPLFFTPYGILGVDQGRATIQTPFMTDNCMLEKGDVVQFIAKYEEYPVNSYYAFHVQNSKEDRTRYFATYESRKDPEELDSMVIDPNSFDKYAELDAYCVIENLGNGVLLVNHHQSMNVGSVPLIDEDPNSPRFAETLIVTDPETGMRSFVYDLFAPEADLSGVYDTNELRWIVSPKYRSIVAIDGTYVALAGDKTEITFDLKGNRIAVAKGVSEGKNK